MAGKVDLSNVGQDKAVQDPDDAVKRACGTYRDAATAMPESEKIDYMPTAPDPQPFVGKGRVSGSR